MKMLKFVGGVLIIGAAPIVWLSDRLRTMLGDQSKFADLSMR